MMHHSTTQLMIYTLHFRRPWDPLPNQPGESVLVRCQFLLIK